MIIVPEMIGSIIGVYNGKTFNQVRRVLPACMCVLLLLGHGIGSPLSMHAALRASGVSCMHVCAGLGAVWRPCPHACSRERQVVRMGTSAAAW
jgi:hypothetical protein